MQKLAIALGLGIALVAAAAALLLANGGPAGADARSTADAGAEASAGAAPDRAATADLAAPADEERGRRAAVTSARDAPAPEATVGPPEPPRRVEGVVVLPRGAPPDPTLRVVASKRRTLDRESRPPDVPDELGENEVLRVPVRSDGSFAMELEGGELRVFLHVDGRWLALAEALRVEPSADDPPRVELAPELGAWLHGTVAPPRAGFAMEGARVVLDEGAARAGLAALLGARTTARCDASGRWELRGRLPRDGASVWAEAPGAASSERATVELLAGGTVGLDLALRPGATIAGRVVDHAGAPLAGVGVRAEALPDEPSDSRFELEIRASFLNRDDTPSDETDDGGRFEIAGVDPGRVRLEAEAEAEHLAARADLELAEGERRDGVELVVDRSESLAGSVLWPDGTPAAGAEVRVVKAPLEGKLTDLLDGDLAANAFVEETLETDAEGAFELRGLGRGVARLHASLETGEGEERRAGFAIASDVALPAAGLTLVLEPLLVLEGYVRDASGAPVTRYRIGLEPDYRRGIAVHQEDSRSMAVEDPEGRFSLDGLTEGSWRLDIDADGFDTSEGITLDLPADALGPPLVVTLERSGGIEGTVLDPASKPIEDARVVLRSGSPEERSDFVSMIDGAGFRATSSDGEGTFSFDGVPVGDPLWLVASHDEHGRSEPLEVRVRPGGSVAGIALRLRSGARITGEVRGEGGAPKRGVEVHLRRGGQGSLESLVPFFEAGSTGKMLERTDDRGRFAFEGLDAGRWVVSLVPRLPYGLGGLLGEEAEAPEIEGRASAQVELGPGDAEHVVLGDDGGALVLVRGRVTAGGEPAECRVAFDAGGGDPETAQTDASGRFEIELAPGLYDLVVTPGLDGAEPSAADAFRFFSSVPPSIGSAGGLTRVVRVPDAREHEIALDLPAGRIAGRVEDEAGAPLSGLAVSIAEGADEASAMTGEDGDFALPFLPEGDYVLHVRGMAFQEGAAGPMSGRVRMVDHTEPRSVRLRADERIDDLVVRVRATPTGR